LNKGIIFEKIKMSSRMDGARAGSEGIKTK